MMLRRSIAAFNKYNSCYSSSVTAQTLISRLSKSYRHGEETKTNCERLLIGEWSYILSSSKSIQKAAVLICPRYQLKGALPEKVIIDQRCAVAYGTSW